MTTELTTESGMHIEPDAKTGAIAASQVTEDIQKVQDQQKAKEAEQPVQQVEEVEKPTDPRKAIMETIYGKRAQQFQNELEYAAQISAGGSIQSAADDGEKSDQQTEIAKEDEPSKRQEQKVELQKQEQEQQAQTPQKKQYIINGQNIELTDQELAQLATNSLRQQQLYNQQYQQNQPRAPQQQVQPQQQTDQPQVDLETDRIREIARKITYGSEDESVKSLKDFAEHIIRSVQRNTVVPTPEQLVQHTSNQVLAQVNFQNNLDTIAREYPDVFQKRPATLVAADYVNNLRNKYTLLGAPKTDIEIYREACELTRGDFGNKSVETTQSQKDGRTAVQVSSTKIERKRAAPQPPAAVSRVLPQDLNQAPTGSDIVNRMRKSRGQSAMN